MLVLTAAFTPMVAVVALPVTAGVTFVASTVADATAGWLGLVVLVAPLVGLGHLTARWAFKYDDVLESWRWRWLPLAATVIVAGACLPEIVSGGRTPDPVYVLWIASVVWMAVFLPLATAVWGPGRRALWAVGPAVGTCGHRVRGDAGTLSGSVCACGPRLRRSRTTGRQRRRRR
jgi:hypothetical protein